jgi:hypothetical protein
MASGPQLQSEVDLVERLIFGKLVRVEGEAIGAQEIVSKDDAAEAVDIAAIQNGDCGDFACTHALES